jgi:hypothetical protein
MYDCEVKVPWMQDGKKVLIWKVRSVELLQTGTHREVRCKHCQGGVRVHKQQVPNGPGDHVEHTSRDDAEHCPGSPLFKGVFRTSQSLMN